MRILRKLTSKVPPQGPFEELFDRDYYLEHNTDVASAGIDPLRHYLMFGEAEGRRPQADFDPVYYARRYRDALKGMGPLEHYIAHGEKAGNVTHDDGFDFDWYKKVYLSSSTSDAECCLHYETKNQSGMLQKCGDTKLIALREIFEPEEYLDLYPEIGGVDPWIHFVGPGYREGRHPSRSYRTDFGNIKNQTLAIRRQGWELRGVDIDFDRTDLSALDKLTSSGGKVLPAFEEALLRAVKELSSELSSLVVLGGLGIGGAERYGTNVFRSLVGIYGVNKVAILVSEGSVGSGAQWLPSGAKVVAISDFLPNADREVRARFVRRFISIVQPETTYCVNSRALWDVAMQPKNALSRFSRFFATLFCYDHDVSGNQVGYAATEFWQCFDFFSGYLIDNKSFSDELIARFSIPDLYQEKLHVVRSPVEIAQTVQATESRSMRALWCGRLARQKLPRVVSQIGVLCPGLHIDMFTAPGDISVDQLQLPPNVRIQPPYDPEKGAPFDEYGAFIYTSLWDGIPTVLLDAASSGIPIVGSVVGGIGEVLTDETGWPVEDVHNAQRYVDGLLEAMLERSEAQRRIEAMRNRVTDLHSRANFDASIQKIERGA